MEELQSILLENMEILCPGFSLHRMALNQHMPRVEKLSEHCHPYHQWLLYLRGGGTQQIEDRAVPVARGTALFIGKGRKHRFIKESDLRPLCLVIDFEAERMPMGEGRAVLSSAELHEIEQLLVAIHEEERRESRRAIRIASLILQTVALVDGAAAEKGNTGPPGAAMASVGKIIAELGAGEVSPRMIAVRCGCTLDHLNRRLKAEGGSTVGTLLNEARLRQCSERLETSDQPIGEIGSAIGMDDQNYFSRWFRKQTGQTPSQWRMLRRNL